MIVLMATGNSPVLNFNIFEGMRTLSANIAVELPETAVNSTHFRVLFMAGLVLFAMTYDYDGKAQLSRLEGLALFLAFVAYDGYVVAQNL